MPDGKALLVETVKAGRGPAPPTPLVPPGPHVQESLGGASPVVTHEDMLQTPHDEDLFEYYATSQLALVDAATGKVTPIGKAGIVESARISPDGQSILVTTIHRPFSYLHAAREFPKEDRNLGPHRQGASQGREPAAGRSRADQRRGHRSAYHSMASQ